MLSEDDGGVATEGLEHLSFAEEMSIRRVNLAMFFFYFFIFILRPCLGPVALVAHGRA